jgi:hypothetical protein
MISEIAHHLLMGGFRFRLAESGGKNVPLKKVLPFR